MPRKPRLHVPGGFFHVILRGNGRSNIFFAREDRSIWESLIADAVQRYGHRIHAYCWMTNHTHMAIQSGPEPLAQFIAYIAGNYARRMNIRMQRTGHLFERRYRAFLVQEDTYLLELVRYIHMNPVRAGLVDRCGDYEWSSHRAYLDSGRPEWLTVDYVLQMFGQSGECAQRNFSEFCQCASEKTLFRHCLGPAAREIADISVLMTGWRSAKPSSRASEHKKAWTRSLLSTAGITL